MRNTLLYYPALLLASFAGPSTLHAQQLYTNGSFSTGSVALNGSVAPLGTTWSEVQNNTGVTTVSNTNSGYTASSALGYSLADDFTVPAGASWTLNNISFFGYQTGYTGTVSPFTELYIRIWNGAPNVATSTIVFGNLTTNRLAASSSTSTYRIFNSLYPTATATGTTRLIWKVRGTISPALVLAPGTYWVEWATNVTSSATHFIVPVTVTGLRQTPGANALQYNPTASAWAAVTDTGNPATTPSVTVDFPFIINDATITATTAANTAGPALRVGPVPTSDNVQVEFSEPRGASDLTLSDAMGRQVWSGKAAARSAGTSVSMTGLAAGVYILSVTSAEGSNRVRVVKN